MSADTNGPLFHETPGGWLAISPEDFPPLGVIADTREEAEVRYRTRAEYWRSLLELAKAQPVARNEDANSHV
jgi:hypothetical protein